MKTSTDYLIIGAGAMGMAFADTVLSESDFCIEKQARPLRI